MSNKEVKRFVGYYALGASDRRTAEDQKTLCIWMTKKPNLIRRFLAWLLVGIYWIDKPRTVTNTVELKKENEEYTSLPRKMSCAD